MVLVLLLFLQVCSLGTAEVDFRSMIARAADKLASDLGTTIDRNALANGLCFSPHDEGSDTVKCMDQVVSESPGMQAISS